MTQYPGWGHVVRLLGVGVLGLVVGWALRGESVRAAGEWHVTATMTPGFLFFRYNTAGEVQGCAATTGPAEVECRRLAILER
jgi:hypothetical protein